MLCDFQGCVRLTFVSRPFINSRIRFRRRIFPFRCRLNRALSPFCCDIRTLSTIGSNVLDTTRTALRCANSRHRTKDASPSSCHASGDLVEGRVGDLVGVKLRGSLHHFRQELLHFRIGIAVVCLRILLLFPQADSNRFQSVCCDESNFVLEAFLLPQQRNDFLLDYPRKLRNALGLQTQ
jgi:hypothetical protein